VRWFFVVIACLGAGASVASAAVPLGAKDGAIEYFRHVFPVRGPHGERGPVGEFGAPRDGGRIHEGFDILAACEWPPDRSEADPGALGPRKLNHRRQLFFMGL
jgi:hypothetical protein